ncbi:DNA-processing protein DprA [Dyadobacter sp. Leaf189]|uniref:DNA-processing protein DprA n=1 Tax=Dyadobacter sp. Leaf189 TaxID=1736295 RepID=UPI0006FF1818|nr:DNA-processing protein DprA [Dyadobacter sp. Leaf189]KQS26928.1 DNA processing protein DprA [Dyadobacter sp. Leaf189]
MEGISEAEKICILALVQTPGVGSVTIRQLISYCGSASKVFDADYKKLIKIPGVGDKVVKAVLAKSELDWAEKEYIRCNKELIDLHFFTDQTYPLRLKPLYDAPIVLYSKGEIDFNAKRAVGVVGTRQISEYGKAVTETIVRDLEPYNALVVSGLAYGVDITAHRACIKHNLPTIGVMASGLDVIYPATHKRTAEEMQINGGIVTENTLQTKPDFMRFPARNRIIAGLSDVVIVVESGKKGGSLITVEFAQNYHRDVYAVPGMIGNNQSEGCNMLIRDHKASIFTSVEDLATALNWTMNNDPTSVMEQRPQHISFEGFTQDEGQVLSMLKQKGPTQIDELAWQSGLHLNKLATLLLNLEFQGMIRSLPGKKYSLI